MSHFKVYLKIFTYLFVSLYSVTQWCVCYNRGCDQVFVFCSAQGVVAVHAQLLGTLEIWYFSDEVPSEKCSSKLLMLQLCCISCCIYILSYLDISDKRMSFLQMMQELLLCDNSWQQILNLSTELDGDYHTISGFGMMFSEFHWMVRSKNPVLRM